jgi:hypothetical protein
MACRVPGMTSVGDRVSNFEDGSIESLNMWIIIIVAIGEAMRDDLPGS